MAIIRKEAYYTSCNGVNSIRALIWADDKVQPVGVVQIAHGLCEHIGRYDEFARFLVSQGYVVCGNDHLGHGKSVFTQELLGMVDEGDNVVMVRDMNTLHNIMAKRYPGLPYIMLGHSMGSFLARLYASSFSYSLAALILSGTTQLPAPLLLAHDPLKFVLNLMPPESTDVNIIVNLFGKITGFALDEKDDYAWLSRNKTNVEAFYADELCGSKISTSLAKELVALAVKSSEISAIRKIPATFPVMLISGAKDPVGFNGTGVLALADQLMLAGNVPEVILYPGDRHEILNEEDREKVFNDIAKFLKANVG